MLLALVIIEEFIIILSESWHLVLQTLTLRNCETVPGLSEYNISASTPPSIVWMSWAVRRRWQNSDLVYCLSSINMVTNYSFAVQSIRKSILNQVSFSCLLSRKSNQEFSFMKRQNPYLKNRVVSVQLILLSTESVSFILNSRISQLSRFSSLVLHSKLRCCGLLSSNLQSSPSSKSYSAPSFLVICRVLSLSQSSYWSSLTSFHVF